MGYVRVGVCCIITTYVGKVIVWYSMYLSTEWRAYLVYKVSTFVCTYRGRFDVTLCTLLEETRCIM